jgi:hypothetical protein
MKTSETIFHYTTTSGLVGILTHHELWASDCQLLNDGTELSYARDFFFAEVKKLKLKPLMDGGYRVAGPSLDMFKVFIACFCEEGDLLSQWRGYGIDQGYALGFNTAQLQALGFGEVVQVQYGITDPSKYFAQEIKDAAEPSAHPGVSEWHASEFLLPRLASVKHPSFKEECEWRILKQLPIYELKQPGTNIRYRISDMGPIAYMVISFPSECLQEIVIGPGNNTETRKAAVLSMLQSLDFQEVTVRVSNIPFRK